MVQGVKALIEWTILPDVSAVLGESPVWDAAGKCVWWVDIDGCKLMRTAFPGMTTGNWPMPERAGFVVLTSRGLPAVGMQTGIFVFDPSTASLDRIVKMNLPGARCNDATVDPYGRLWVGGMDMEARAGRGVLYCVGKNCQPETMLEGLHIPNGLAFDGDRERLYLSDSGPDIRTVWAFDLEPGSSQLHRRKEFAVFGDADGKPDGAALDEVGNYWSAAILGGALRVFSPQGETISVHATPFSEPTKPAFCGDSLDRIFLTSRQGAEPGGRIAIVNSAQISGHRGRPVQRWDIGG